MSELADFLTARGYVRVPLTRSGVGHFHTAGTLNGRPVEVLVDTGAACTVIAMSVVQELGLRSEWVDSGAGGAGGSALDQFRVDGADLRLGSFVPRLAGPAGLDFEHVNAALRAQGSAEVDVILGVDVRCPRGRYRLSRPVLVLEGGRRFQCVRSVKARGKETGRRLDDRTTRRGLSAHRCRPQGGVRP